MAPPEWMKKFQEIGQKGEEEVTAVGNDGFVKTGEQRKKGFSSDDGSDDEENAASMFHAAAAAPTKSHDQDDAAALFRAAGPTKYNDDSNQSFASRDPPAVSSSNSSSASSSSGEASSDGVNSEDANTNEDFGESWVVDQDKVNRDSDDIDSEAAPDEGRQSFDAGESFITEEVLVDEHGNEILADESVNDILVDENGNEIVDESDDEIEVDENGNEVPAEDDKDEVQVDENVDETQEEGFLVDENVNEIVQDQQQNIEAAYPTARNDGERRTVPSGAAYVYDIEEQRKILGDGKMKNRSRMSWCIPLLVFAMIVASILLVIFLVVYEEDRASYDTIPTMAPTQEKLSDCIDAAATTEFDAIQKDCSFGSLLQPNIIDQCNCGDRNVDILADDIRARWEGLVQNFIPSIYPEWNEPINSCSPENQALLWLSSGINNGGEIDRSLRLQRYGLAIVYYQQGGTQWSRSTNWLSEKNVCEWEGVECNENLHVRILNLDENQLKGQLSIAPTLLDDLEAYYAANNNLSGSIPDAYFNDNSLRYIDLSDNSLSGEFSSDISDDSKLASINFASNNLKGTIPSKISKITGLNVLNIGSNAFSGELPASLFTLPLTELSIGANEFEGTIPVNLTDVSTLTSLSLGPNLFTGDLPTSLSKLTALKRLSIVEISELNGRLPAAYGLSLTALVEFSISGTNVEGNIPYQFGAMTSLETLQLSNNRLRQKIPSALSLLTNLKSLSLNGNALTGTIPSEMGLLTSIQELQFHGNKLSGTIPDEFENLLEIRTLTFDNNLMNGRVPNGVCALRDAELNKFVVDCPTQASETLVDGIICSIPACCTECL